MFPVISNGTLVAHHLQIQVDASPAFLGETVELPKENARTLIRGFLLQSPKFRHECGQLMPVEYGVAVPVDKSHATKRRVIYRWKLDLRPRRHEDHLLPEVSPLAFKPHFQCHAHLSLTA